MQHLTRLLQPGLQVIASSLVITVISSISNAQTVSAIKKDIEIDYFLISGGSINEIRKSLKRKGPNSYWALTSWRISWDDSCNILLKAKMQLPRLHNSIGMPSSERSIVEKMLLALRLHEERHLDYGILAAEEIRRHECENASGILEYWIEKNNEFDRNTNNGRTDGVVLK